LANAANGINNGNGSSSNSSIIINISNNGIACEANLATARRAISGAQRPDGFC
jgi:hypothetical protein